MFPTTHLDFLPSSSRSTVPEAGNEFYQLVAHLNGTINAETVNFNAGQAVVKRTEYDEFEYIKRGHFTSVEDLGSIDLVDWDWKWRNGELIGRHKARKTICTVEIIDRKSKFTAMFYEGKDAHRFWEDDFRQFSRIENSGSFRLFGINQSAIPALIFHHELIPLAHIFTRSFWMDIYIEYLRSNMGCYQTSLWIDTTSGVLCRGPKGPYFCLFTNAVNAIVVPPTVDMLKEDISLRFFSKFGSRVDDDVLAFMTDYETEDSGHSVRISPMHPYTRGPPHHLPMNDIGGLWFDAVYSPSLEAAARRPQGAGSLWGPWESHRRGLADEIVLDGGLTRFKFDPTQGGQVYLRPGYGWWKFWDEWLSQSCRVFDALNVTQGEENFFVIRPPTLVIQSTPRQYECLVAPFNFRYGQPLVEDTQLPPIYLFLHSLPMTISEFVSWRKGRPYFWSFDETGRCEMSEEECEQWGLPVLTLSSQGSARLWSWPTSTYTALRDWQKARGFSPATSDWARELGYLELEIIGARKSISLSKPLMFEKKRKWAVRVGKPSRGQESAHVGLQY
ncbi:hypothetical protein Moror_4248 [Moniliophthora roreri MCA 2997]|uniref:Uncharacterized protein n=1 Tax=Moniliophthora roreri (strain MCA 2997) TaxID=1381753 RepID=V2YFW4_MONRO|nr:hypothetical protein Moror_4248 [Moniliophthora roreri MCA 2997]